MNTIKIPNKTIILLNVRRIYDFEGSTIWYWFSCVAFGVWPIAIFLLSIRKGKEGSNKYGARNKTERDYFKIFLPLAPVSYVLFYLLGWVPNELSIIS